MKAIKKYITREEFMEAIGVADKGKSRAELLSIDENRNLVLNSGANIFLISGDKKDSIDNVYIGVIERLNSRSGKRDGIGGLGGLAERTNKENFAKLSIVEQRLLVGKKDDVIIDENGLPELINDINLIRINNVTREAKEELNDIGINDFELDIHKAVLVPMPGVEDNNYIVNIWDGKTNPESTYAITPFCHRIQVDEALLDKLVDLSQNPQAGSEVKSFIKMPLFQALGRMGKKDNQGNDDLEYNYRYPHEFLVAWNKASEIMEYNPEKMIALTKKVQKSIGHRLDFSSIAKKMNVPMTNLNQILNLKRGTIEKMQVGAYQIFNQKNNKIQKTKDLSL